jgi:hypothetical protein
MYTKNTCAKSNVHKISTTYYCAAAVLLLLLLLLAVYIGCRRKLATLAQTISDAVIYLNFYVIIK